MSDLCPVAVSQDSAELEHEPKTVIESQVLLWKLKKYCDVIFTFPNLPDRIEAHEFCLKARSPVFEQIFRMRKSGNVQGNEIEISESTPERFQQFLEFIYSDKFEADMTGALDLLQLAHKYKVHLLTKACEEILATEIQVDDSVKVFESARRYCHKELMDRAGQIMVTSLQHLLIVGALASADEETVTFLLKRDDLQVEEVQLFGFLLKWGRSKVGASDDEELLKGTLKNVISKIRYTNMTPFEFTTIVVPTGLLSTEETLSVYSYICGDESSRWLNILHVPARAFAKHIVKSIIGVNSGRMLIDRKDLKMKFNTNGRKGNKMESIVNFFAGQESKSLWAPAFNKQGICFVAERLQVVRKGWSDCRIKQAVITGIKFMWPVIRDDYKDSVTLNFKIFVTELLDPFSEENMTVRFTKTVLNRKSGVNEVIPVQPPVEFTSGASYRIVIEDQSTSDVNDSHRTVDQRIFAGKCFPNTNKEASVYFHGAQLTLHLINKMDKLYGPEFYEGHDEVTVIRGLRVGLV